MTSNLTPILEKASNADTIILGSQIYLHSVTGAMRSFLEKPIFQYLVYDTNHTSLFQRKIPAGFIYTMNVTNEQFKTGYEDDLKSLKTYIEKTFGSFESLVVNDT
ncbi:hypothetical protein [Clostridium beijerinckii]|uniref:hypothetical protein n=1 Tax=Clostridium beijerinckii TaxID=1520 RepID=UPI0015C8E49D|nr:hypothetical protein [Clostridium beijerinckii]NOW05321.1 multimeric flavodoxin WrbA [Clostridium beijerinckii]NYC01537.1 multimeric flavodoxin WrbA [Clostridium beijerinckii]